MRETIYFYFMHTHILFILSFVLLVAAAHVGAAHTCIDKERQALLDFKAPLHDPYNMLSTWTPDEEDDCCQWLGVTCNNQTGHVTELYFYGYGLGGEISLSLLNLTFLDISRNEFTGTIPESIGNMTQLTVLDLSYNKFSGTIPISIGSLTSLTWLDLSENKFSGVIPKSIGSLTKLTHLYLGSNKFSGTIPMSIGSLTKLTSFQLSDNSFYGTIPREFGNLNNLEYLFLDSLGSCRVENLDWLSSLSSLYWLTIDGTSLAKANNRMEMVWHDSATNSGPNRKLSTEFVNSKWADWK
ncbi:leucine-rich repeat-containing protein [Tanacetum coccineum]